MSRLQTVLNVYAFYVVGIFLAAVPWTPVWDHTTGLLPSLLRVCARSGWVKGAVSGLGALDLLTATREAGSFLRSFRSGEPPSRP